MIPMENLDELKKELADKEMEFRNLCDSITLSGKKTAEQETQKLVLKEELQHLLFSIHLIILNLTGI